MRRPTGFGGYHPAKPARAPKPVAPRRPDYEQMLCGAIMRRLLVEMRYENDFSERTVAPYVVFETDDGSVCLASTQVSNPNKPGGEGEPRNFTVGKIATLRVTQTAFNVDPRFDPHDPKYASGVLCMVQRF